MIDSLKAQGVELPDIGERKPRPGTRIRPNKQKKEQTSGIYKLYLNIVFKFIAFFFFWFLVETKPEEPLKIEEVAPVQVEIVEKPEEKEPESEEDVKDAWDASSEDEEESEETAPSATVENKTQNERDGKKADESSFDEESDGGSGDSDSESIEEEDLKSQAEKARERAIDRIKVNIV